MNVYAVDFYETSADYFSVIFVPLFHAVLYDVYQSGCLLVLACLSGCVWSAFIYRRGRSSRVKKKRVSLATTLLLHESKNSAEFQKEGMSLEEFLHSHREGVEVS